MIEAVVRDLAALALVPTPTGDAERKARGAFFTPPAIAQHLARWAIGRTPSARVLDPTCGDGVFLVAAGTELLAAGARAESLDEQVVGIDLDEASLQGAQGNLTGAGLDARLVVGDAIAQDPPGQLFSSWHEFDAVIGNPPFVRYQSHTGSARSLSIEAALRQGVRLSRLASSWAAHLVHASAFLAPGGRLAMVLPAELLTVGYAEPIRAWLRTRFASVNLVVFEHLQFADALENVVLLLAQGSGGCDAFNLFYVQDATELADIGPFDGSAVALAEGGKWTNLLLSTTERNVFARVTGEYFSPLGEYGALELGTVTGANRYFAITESTREQFGLRPRMDVLPISPPGTKHLKGLSFSRQAWDRLRAADERVWLFRPPDGESTEGIERYKRLGEDLGVPSAYKCTIRPDWWRPPVTPSPDVFFTYMSHRYPRLITNHARVAFLNSMHGLRLNSNVTRESRAALPLLTLNSVTMLGAELNGRSYGGGLLKMEPSEARQLPVPSPDHMDAAWGVLRPERQRLDRQLRAGQWANVVARIDQVLLSEVMGLSRESTDQLHESARALRARRLARGRTADA